MECQDIRLILAFSDRASEKLDPVEGQALQHHLEACVDCAQAAERQHADHGLDQAIGLAMRDVPIASGLAATIKQRLAADRPVMRKRWVGAAAAAVLALALSASGVYYVYQPTDIAIGDLRTFPQFGEGWTIDQVESYFKDNGLEVKAPREFDYGRLRNVEIVLLQKRRVPKLTFSDDQSKAHVLVLSHRVFRVPNVSDDPSVLLIRHDDFTYVLYSAGQGRPDNFVRPLH